MIKRILSENAPKAVGSYSVGSEYQNILFLSGQLPINSKIGKIENLDIEGQTKQSMDNIKAILDDNGSDMNHVIKTTVFLDSIEDFQKFDQVYKTYFNESFPSRSAFEVGKLPMGALIEIEVIAAKK